MGLEYDNRCSISGLPNHAIWLLGMNKLLIQYPLSTTAPLTLLVPIFALISGYFMYDEVLSIAQVVASVLFLVGIGLIVKPGTTERNDRPLNS